MMAQCGMLALGCVVPLVADASCSCSEPFCSSSLRRFAPFIGVHSRRMRSGRSGRLHACAKHARALLQLTTQAGRPALCYDGVAVLLEKLESLLLLVGLVEQLRRAALERCRRLFLAPCALCQAVVGIVQVLPSGRADRNRASVLTKHLRRYLQYRSS